MNIEQLFQNGINNQNQGNLELAAQCYNAVIQQDSRHFGALVNLGTLLKKQGNIVDASKCIQQALTVNQNSPELWFNYANLLQTEDKISAALKAFRQAITIKPDFFSAHFNLANLLRDERQLQQAEKHFKTTLKLQPDFTRGYTNLGNLQRRLKKHPQAIKSHKKALSLEPNNADIHYNLGRAMIAAEQYDKAMDELKKALKLRADFTDAQLEIAHLHIIDDQPEKTQAIYNKLIAQQPPVAGAYIGKSKIIAKQAGYQAAYAYIAKIYADNLNSVELAEITAEFAIQSQQYQAAIDYCQQAIKLKPKQIKHYNLLGLAQMQAGQIDAARISWSQAINLNPQHEVDARVYLGQLAHKQKQHDEALGLLRHAVSLAPERTSPSINLGFVLLKLGVVAEVVDLAENLLKEFPESADVYALKGFAHVQNASIDIAATALQKAISIHEKNKNNSSNALMPSVYSDSLFSSLYNDQLDAQQIKALHVKTCKQLSQNIPTNTFKLDKNITKRALRVAYFSPDLCSHPIGFFLEPILANHNPDNCEVFCYSLSADVDDITARLKKSSPHWRDCAYLDDEQIITQMRQDNIDIVIDLVGHTAKNRLSVLAKRTAPIQAIYLGYPATTGLQQMDYIIADKHLIPAEFNQHYTETPVLLKNTSFLCYQPQPDTPEVAQPPCLENGYITFGSFNNLPKVSTATIALWSQVLIAVANSRLVLKALAFTDVATRELFWQRFAEHGIAKNRIDLLPPTQPLSKFMGEYRLMDIALDSTPYNGGTTSCDALWMGVPVLTLSAHHFCTRMSNSILQAIDRPQWVASSETEFIQKAIDLAADYKHLKQLRNTQRTLMAASSLCQAQAFTEALEKVYQQMVAKKLS